MLSLRHQSSPHTLIVIEDNLMAFLDCIGDLLASTLITKVQALQYGPHKNGAST
jgi:hypothetical protein